MDNSYNFDPTQLSCQNGTNFTNIYLFPHGLPLHHRGCSQRMTWMIDTLERIYNNHDPKVPITILLTPGAHFSIVNKGLFYRRLVEVREKISKLVPKMPNAKFIIKTPNYFRGDYNNLNNVFSGYNAYVMQQVILNVFNKTVVKVIDVYDMTKVSFDHIAASVPGIHLGTAGGSPWLLTGMLQFFDKELDDYLHGKNYETSNL